MTAVVARGCRGKAGTGYEQAIWGDRISLDLDYGSGYVASYIVKTHSTVLLKRASFTINCTSINPTFL